MKWLVSIADELGGPDRVHAMLKGQGVSFILKSIQVNFRRPVTFPDTVRCNSSIALFHLDDLDGALQLLVAHKPHLPTPLAGSSPTEKPKSHFNVAAVAYSYSQGAVVAESDSVIVWYDYDKLKKCDPGEAAREVIWRRLRAT